MKTIASTAASATKVTLSAALAVVTVHVVEHGFGIKLNGETAEMMGAITVVYHALLHYFGFGDMGEKVTPPPTSPPAQ